jgi:biotin transport system substrate-specific component
MTSTTATPVLAAPLRGTWVRDAALVALATAFIAMSAQIAVPLPFTPVPLTGQTLAVLLTAATLGASLGLASSALYFGLALIGFPVLAPTAEGTHVTGNAVLAMPSLGYVVGFLIASLAVGRLAELGFTRTPLRVVVAMVAGNAAIYLAGVVWLQHSLNATWSQAVAWGLTPFLIGDAIKLLLAAGLLPTAWKFLR